MAKLNTVKRVEVTMVLDADEALALSNHLKETADENSDNNVLSISQNLDYAINGRPKLTDEEKEAKQKLKEAKLAEKEAKAKARLGQKPGTASTAAPAAPAPAEKAANGSAEPAKKKVTVPAN